MPANGRSCGKCDYYQEESGTCHINPEPAEGFIIQHWCGQYKPDTHRKEKKTGTTKDSYGKFVKMFPEEYDKLVAEFGHKRINETIQKMDAWCNKPGNKYTDFNLAIRVWLKRDTDSVPQGPIF